MSEIFLEARGVSKLFGEVRALDNVDLRLGSGVTGLLGPNGSGKSTLLKLFAGQLLPDEGEVRLLGADPFSEAHSRRDLGLCPEQDAFYEDLSGLRFVEVLTRLHGHSAAKARALSEAAIEEVGMTAHAHKALRQMSRGMRQRIKIAQAIAHEPAVILLDEPLTGADPVARTDLVRLIRRLGAQGRCVLVSSHVLHEVQAMTHQVVLIRFGRMRAQGDVFRLRTLLTDRPYRVELTVDDARRYAAQIVESPHVLAASFGCGADQLELTLVDLEAALAELHRVAAAQGQTIRRISSPDTDLESLYRYLVSAPGGRT